MTTLRTLAAYSLGGLLWATAAQAQSPVLTTHVRHNGLSCVQYGTAFGTSSAFPQHGWMLNDNADAKEIRCPLPIVNNTLTYPDAHVSVWVYDRSTTAGVSCQLRVYSGNDVSSSFSFDSAATSNLDQNAHELLMSIDQGVLGYPQTRFFLNCSVPGLNGSGQKSGIMSYEFDTDVQ